MSLILEGITLGVVVSAPIGPINLEIIRRGLKNGFIASSMFSTGVVIALVVYLSLASVGLSFLAEYKLFNLLFFVFGEAVILFLAFNCLKAYFKNEKIDLEVIYKESKKHLLHGVLLTLSNPGLLVFWTGILGADIIARKNDSISSTFYLCLGIVLGVILFCIGLVYILHVIRKRLPVDKFKYISLLSGIALLGFALRFGYNFL